MSTVTAHVSDCPNHQTLRNTPMYTRFNVAAFGVLGYECNIAELSKEDVKAIQAQITLYKKWRDVLQYGQFYRGRCADNMYEWTCVSEDQKKAVGMVLQVLVQPNTSFLQYQPKGLKPDVKYVVLSGPSHAEEVGKLMPTTVAVASDDIKLWRRFILNRIL